LVDFGLTQARRLLAACSSVLVPGVVNTIDFITISSTGNAADFGDLTQVRYSSGTCSSSTRGVIGGGYSAPGGVNTIDFITISSTGNAYHQEHYDLTLIQVS
jgi:hypothetical protein